MKFLKLKFKQYFLDQKRKKKCMQCSKEPLCLFVLFFSIMGYVKEPKLVKMPKGILSHPCN